MGGARPSHASHACAACGALHPRRQILKEIIEKKEGMGDIMKASFFSMTQAVYSGGEGIKYTIIDNVGGP